MLIRSGISPKIDGSFAKTEGSNLFNLTWQAGPKCPSTQSGSHFPASHVSLKDGITPFLGGFPNQQIRPY